MAHFALLWKARTIEKYRQNYENEKYLSIQDTNVPIPQKSLTQRLRCYRQDTQKRFSKIFHRMYPEGSSLSNFFQYLRTDQTCLHLVLKNLLGFLIGLGLTYLCFLFLVFQLSISLFHATIVSSIIGVLLTMGLAFSYRIRCLILLLLPQFFSRAGRYTLTCYALVLILTGPATNTLKNSEVLTESMACRQEQIKSLLNEVKDTTRRPLNAMRDSIKIMVQKIRLFARELKQTLLKVNRLTLSVLETIQSSFSWLQRLSGECNTVMGSPFNRCLKVLQDGYVNYKRRFEQKKAQSRRMANKIEEVCSNVKHYREICVFTDFVNGSFVASIRRRLKDYAERIRNLLFIQIHVHHSYSFSSNTSHSASQVAAGIVTEIRKRADPLLTWLSWSSCVTSLFLLLIIFRAKYYQNMFETRSRFDNKYITKELRDLDLKRLRHGKETILPLNKRERSKYVSTTSFRLVASEKIHLNRSIVFMGITTFKLLIHMVADYSLYWVLMTIRHHGKNQTPLPFGVPNAGMHVTGKGRVADLFRYLLSALTSPLERTQPLTTNCLPDPHPPNLQRYTQIGILIFLLWFFALFEPYGLRLRHVIMGLYRPERAKARAEWLYNHILRTRGGFMKFARRKLHRSYKYCSEEKYTFKRWLNEHIPLCWLRCLLGISRDEPHCLLCSTKQDLTDSNTKLEKCNTQGCPGVYCRSCFSDIGELCTICLSPSDYGDLSDVSLEKGSSDESDDDSGGSHGGDVVPKNDVEISKQDIFDDDSDDILMPKPLRDNKNDNNITRDPREHVKYNMTRIQKETFNLKGDKLRSEKELLKIRKSHLNIYFRKKHEVWRGNVLYCKIISLIIYAHWNIYKNTWMYIHITVIKYINNRSIYLQEDKTEESNNGISCKENHVKSNRGQGEQKSKQTQNRPVSKDVSGKGDDIGKNGKRTDKKTNKNEGMQRGAINGDDNIDYDDISNTEQEFPCCSLKQFNAAFCSYWLGIKNNLCNGFNFLTQAVINNTLEIDEKNNYKTRKKISLEIPESNALRCDTKDSREYRLFTFLAEQEWVIRKNFQYESTEKENSLLSERPDIKTVDHLKNDLYSHTVHYKEVSFTQCTTSSLQPKSTEMPEQYQALRNEVTNTKLKRQVLVCEDCKFNCMCPGNPLNALFDIPVICNDNKEVNSGKQRGIIINQIESPCSSVLGCNGTKVKKVSIMEKMKACIKSCFTPKCRKKRKRNVHARGNTSISCIPAEIKTGSDNIIKKKHDCECKCQNRSVQFDENDCPCRNRSIQAKCNCCCSLMANRRGASSQNLGKSSTPVEIDTKSGNINKQEQEPECVCKDRSCQFDKNSSLYHNRSFQTDVCCFDHQCENPDSEKLCDPLCPVECDCQGHGIDLTKTCDPLCPVDCECDGKGLMLMKCDPLCPDECPCEGRGLKIKKCDVLCPEECICQDDVENRGVHYCQSTTRLVQNIHNLTNSAATINNDSNVILRGTDEKRKKCDDKRNKRNTKVEWQYCENCCESMPAEEKFCSCAVQCVPPQYERQECCGSSTSYASYTVSFSDGTFRSDYTGTDNMCYACYDYYDTTQRPRRRVVFIAKQNQSTGTDAAIKYNVGTITNERGLVRKNRYFLLDDGVVVEPRYTENRGVCTKKSVTFKSRVHIIPSYIFDSSSDIYTPSRYLLESQRYYNELFAYMPHVYPIRAIKERIKKRKSLQGSRSRYRNGGQAPRLDYDSYVKRQKKIPKKLMINPLEINGNFIGRRVFLPVPGT